MNRDTMMETKWGKILFGFFLFAMLLLARDTLITSCILGFTKSQILMLGIIGLLGLVFLIRNRTEWKQLLTDRRILLMGISALLLLVPMAVKRDWQLMYFSILICLLLPIFLTWILSWQEAAKYYVCILAGLGLYSLVGMYLLKPLALSGKLAAEVFLNSAEMPFYSFGLTFVVPWELWHRNFGIFREPGVYQFFLILGIYLNHYGVIWNKAWKMWLMTAVLSATLISTFAIGGFIELGLLAVFVYFEKRYYRTTLGKLAVAAVLAAIAFVAWQIISALRVGMFELTVYYELYDMLKRLTTGSDSMVDRISAILISAGLFLKNPLFGDTIANVLHGTAHNTSSTLILFAVGGAGVGLLNVAAWMALIWKKERNIFGNLILMAILFMSFNTQNLTADVFFWLFPYMALTETVLKNWKNPERKA